MATNNNQTGWVGWVKFAGIFMIVAGLFQGLEGLVALLRRTFYIVTPNHLAVLNFTAWGWIHLTIGVLILAAGLAVLNGSVWGRAVGAFVAILSLLANMAFIAAYPLWSITVMLVDVLVIYALIVHGGEVEQSSSQNN